MRNSLVIKRRNLYVHVCMCTRARTHTRTRTYRYIYIYIERERERESNSSCRYCVCVCVCAYIRLPAPPSAYFRVCVWVRVRVCASRAPEDVAHSLPRSSEVSRKKKRPLTFWHSSPPTASTQPACIMCLVNKVTRLMASPEAHKHVITLQTPRAPSDTTWLLNRDRVAIRGQSGRG